MISSWYISDAPLVKISNPPKVEFASETIITSIIQSVPSPEKIHWQISKDGKIFHEIDITQPKYYGSNLNPETPRLVIKRTTFDDKLFYRLFVSNALGDNYSNTVDLKITGGMYFVMLTNLIQTYWKFVSRFWRYLC